MGIESTSEVWESAPRNHFVRPETTDDGCGTTMAKGKILKTRAEHAAVMKSC